MFGVREHQVFDVSGICLGSSLVDMETRAETHANEEEAGRIGTSGTSHFAPE